MTKKLSLALDGLCVESFETAAAQAGPRGTVEGRDATRHNCQTQGCTDATCGGAGCIGTVLETCWESCAEGTCGLSCGGTCTDSCFCG